MSPLDEEERRIAVAWFRDVVAGVSAALYEHDPVGLADAGAPSDEYDFEARAVVVRLAREHPAPGQDDIRAVVFEEFVRRFGEELAGDEDGYADVALAIGGVWAENA